MRKIIRNTMRNEAKRLGVKASQYVREQFDRYQVEKYGEDCRRKNKIRGTHKRRTWKSRLETLIY